MEEFIQEYKNFIFSYREYQRMDHNKLKKHMHPFYEILYMVDGAVDYAVEDNSYHLEKGDLVLISPANYHFVHRITKAPYMRFVINFLDDFLPEPSLIQSVFGKGDFFRLPAGAPIERLLFMLKDILPQVPQDRTEMLCRNFLTLILISLLNLEGNHPQRVQTVSKSCQELIDYININLTSLQNLDDLASHFFFSKTYLNHMFKREMNISVMQFIRNKKILLAEKLIRSGKKPSEAYLECGFNNYVSFYRAYCRYLGISPADSKNDSK